MSGDESSAKKTLLSQLILCVFCTIVGALYPALLDLSKTTLEKEVSLTGSAMSTTERRAYPFSSVSVVLINDLLQLSIALIVVGRKEGLRALFADAQLLLKMAPLGFIYAIGELFTLRAIQKGTGPVYVVIANMKLVIAALMSRAFFGRSWAMPLLHWMELVMISLLAAAFTLVEAGALGAQWSWEGAWMALAKSTVVSFTSVFCEHTYKNNGFLIVVTLQAFWGLVTILLLLTVSSAGLAATGIALELRDDAGAWSLFGGGPHMPLCTSSDHAQCVETLSQGVSRAMVAAGEASCHCINNRGWNVHTLGAVAADLSNAVSSALIFKRISAVAKYVCRAMSAVPMYICYCFLGRSSWNLGSFALVVLLCGQVSAYTLQRHWAAENLPEAEWTKEYEAVASGRAGGVEGGSQAPRRRAHGAS